MPLICNRKIAVLVGKEPTDTLERVVLNHQLMSALARLLGDDSNQTIELVFSLGKLSTRSEGVLICCLSGAWE